MQADTPFVHNIAPFPITSQPKPLLTFTDKREVLVRPDSSLASVFVASSRRRR